MVDLEIKIKIKKIRLLKREHYSRFRWETQKRKRERGN
jgi:hypothetical protein